MKEVELAALKIQVRKAVKEAASIKIQSLGGKKL